LGLGQPVSLPDGADLARREQAIATAQKMETELETTLATSKKGVEKR